MSNSLIDNFPKLLDYLNNPKTTFDKKILQDIVKKYDFLYISELTNISKEKKLQISNSIKKSKIIIFDAKKSLNKQTNKNYLIIGFKKTIIIHDISSASSAFLHFILSINPNICASFLSNTKNIIQQIIHFQNNEIFIELQKLEEIQSLNKAFQIKSPINKLWSLITPTISCYLIHTSHLKTRKHRISQFISDSEKEITENHKKEVEHIKEDDYIELRIIGTGSSSRCALIYHIKKGELYVIKQTFRNNIESPKLINRETNNYSKIRFPFLPKFYGIACNQNRINGIVIEFINGRSLDNISAMALTYNDKITLIFELILIFQYFRQKEMIYRDLKPNNIMVDEHKTIVLIDFDRLIPNNDESEKTNDFASGFLAPEVVSAGLYSYESDIFSLGKMIEYIAKTCESSEYSRFEEIINICTRKKAESRPTILYVLQIFISKFNMSIMIDNLYSDLDVHCRIFKTITQLQINQNNFDQQLALGLIYEKGWYIKPDIEKAIHYYTNAANHNHLGAQFILGVIYSDGHYVVQDIKKALHYYSLSAAQNHPGAQFNLGVIYSEGKYVTRNIDKAIHYYLLAANQNYPPAQYNLGLIYEEGRYIARDINKAINYYSLAANQNYPEAQFSLGLIYEEGQYVARNIDKAIAYYSSAANQNHPQAQFNLGIVYYNGKYVEPDMKKAVHYISLAANQNYPQAQHNIGYFYYRGDYYAKDIKKAIHYFTLASDQNVPESQYNLGNIYYLGEDVVRDVNKAIYYFSLAANQNLLKAQLFLGDFYYLGRDTTRNINKAIHYYSLAANQNHPNALFLLGFFYYDGKYVARDINKSIHYNSLAAYQNHPKAQLLLGEIYYFGEFIARDIKKAILYFYLAANQNESEAQFILGVIYLEGKYAAHDINKAIYYFSLAANQNYLEAQFNLGKIYLDGRYIEVDIHKAIHYFTLAANQNIPKAQYNLGVIFSNGKYISRDINKAIHYFTLAANQEYLPAQFMLGAFYSEGRLVKCDIKKAIHYFSLAANKNFPQAQFMLGAFYSEGKYVTRDMNKAIYYFSLAANQNSPEAQYNLGVIYSDGKYISCDVNKAIHYFSLAANQEYPLAQFTLGIIYSEGRLVKCDIKKAFHYFSLAANNNYPQAQFMLGAFYSEGKYVTRDMNKAIHYFTLSSNKNNHDAQLILGIFNYSGYGIPRDIKKGTFYINLASKNGQRQANFAYGFLLHKSHKYEEAIHYYKESSSFNNQYAKNNLGILYKNGYDNINGQSGKAIVYFEEAIRQKYDFLSMYNLSHIYIYDETIKGDINKAIELLIKSSYVFHHSMILLCILLVKTYGFQIDLIKNEIEKHTKEKNGLWQKAYQIIIYLNLFDNSILETYYNSYRSKDFVYDILLMPVLSSDLKNEDKSISKSPFINTISSLFYEGFGIPI